MDALLRLYDILTVKICKWNNDFHGKAIGGSYVYRAVL